MVVDLWLAGWYGVGKVFYSTVHFYLRVCCLVWVELVVCGIVLFVGFLLLS